MGVYTTWNVWDDALDLFSDRIAYSEPVPDVYEGRDCQRFTVSLRDDAPQSKRDARRKRKDGQPVHLGGEVWLDGQTAVRLKADVSGVWQKGDVEKTVQLKLDRTDLGSAPEITIPDGPIERRTSSLPRSIPSVDLRTDEEAPLDGGDQQR